MTRRETIQAEGPISLDDAVSVVKMHGHSHCSIRSLMRWHVAGKAACGASGRVRLEAVRINGQLHTSHLAVIRFLKATFPALHPTHA